MNSSRSAEGHRQRLREKFLQAGLEGFLDYEIIELLLTLGTPRRDCKPIAREAIVKFNGFVGVMDASSQELQKIKGIGPSNVFGIKLIHEAAKRYALEKLKDKPVFDSPDKIFEYLREKIGKLDKETFVILYLDVKNRLEVEDISVGTLSASLVHPREVFKKAITSSASHIVIAHNHPSGDPTPSQEDIVTTRRLIDAGKVLGVQVVDHIVVSYNKFVSMKLENLL